MGNGRTSLCCFDCRIGNLFWCYRYAWVPGRCLAGAVTAQLKITFLFLVIASLKDYLFSDCRTSFLCGRCVGRIVVLLGEGAI